MSNYSLFHSDANVTFYVQPTMDVALNLQVLMWGFIVLLLPRGYFFYFIFFVSRALPMEAISTAVY